MEPDRWREIEHHYQAAVDLPATGRAAYLAANCASDPDLLQHVQAMFASDAQAGAFLETPAMGVIARSLAAHQAPSPGTIGHYRILERLGAGGMGVVYKAQDTRLGRFAAIKLLPASLPADSAAFERLRREARVASSLDHPNICTVYELGQHAGQPFIAMQYLEGQTLKSYIGGKPLHLDQFIDLALQIAAGLDAAHARAVIHRDIKPANIMITGPASGRPGQARILDFGIAKLTSDNTSGITSPGMALGTAGYMSPEQARGDDLDARTDLFSFGAVLYEMATGREAFPGRTVAVIHDSILNREPAPPSTVNPALPAAVDAVIAKALEKDRELRSQTAAELRADLKRLQRDTGSGKMPLAAAPPRRLHPSRLVAALALTLALVITALAWLAWRAASTAPAITERQLTATFGSLIVEAALSPDGASFAYADAAGLHVKIVDTFEVHDLPWIPGVRVYQIVWTPDSRSLLVSAMPGTGTRTSLWSVSVIQGAPKLLHSDVRDFAVSSDGTRIAFNPNTLDSLWIMDIAGETPRRLLAAPPDRYFSFPNWSPGDRWILYGSVTRDTARKTFLSVDPVTGAPGSFRTEGDFGWELIAARSNRFFTLGGENLTDSLFEIDHPNAAPARTKHRLRQWADTYVYRPTLSADGRRMALLKRVSEQAVYVADILDGGKRVENARRLVLGGTVNRVRGWTPDGSAVVFERTRGGSIEIFRQRLDQVNAEPLVTTREQAMYGRITPDGKWLYYRLTKADGAVHLMRMPAAGGPPQLVWVKPGLETYHCASAPVNLCIAAVRQGDQRIFYRFDPALDPPPGGFTDQQMPEVARNTYGASSWVVSPDGTLLAMVKPDINEGRIHIQSLTGSAPAPDVLVKGWTDLAAISWAYKGNGWYVSNQMIRTTGKYLYVDPAGNATPLNTPDSFVPCWGTVSPDGRHLAFTAFPGLTNAWLLENF